MIEPHDLALSYIWEISYSSCAGSSLKFLAETYLMSEPEAYRQGRRTVQGGIFRSFDKASTVRVFQLPEGHSDIGQYISDGRCSTPYRSRILNPSPLFVTMSSKGVFLICFRRVVTRRRIKSLIRSGISKERQGREDH